MSATDQTEPLHLMLNETTGDRVLLYEAGNGVRLELQHSGDTFWMTQEQIASLFGIERSGVSKHFQISLAKANWTKLQYVKKVHELPPTERPTRSNTTISMPSSVSDIGSARSRARFSANGRPACWSNSRPKASSSTSPALRIQPNAITSPNCAASARCARITTRNQRLRAECSAWNIFSELLFAQIALGPS
jgi:hypothetical protein